MYNNYDPKKRKIFCFALAVLMLVVPVLFILVWPTVGIILSLLGAIVWLSWDTLITKVAKKLHHLFYKEEMK